MPRELYWKTNKPREFKQDKKDDKQRKASGRPRTGLPPKGFIDFKDVTPLTSSYNAIYQPMKADGSIMNPEKLNNTDKPKYNTLHKEYRHELEYYNNLKLQVEKEMQKGNLL